MFHLRQDVYTEIIFLLIVFWIKNLIETQKYVWLTRWSDIWNFLLSCHGWQVWDHYWHKKKFGVRIV